MLSENDPAIIHALKTVKYKNISLLFQHENIIHSNDYLEVTNKFLESCNEHGFVVERSGILEPQCETFYKNREFIHLQISLLKSATDVPLVTTDEY